ARGARRDGTDLLSAVQLGYGSLHLRQIRLDLGVFEGARCVLTLQDAEDLAVIRGVPGVLGRVDDRDVQLRVEVVEADVVLERAHALLFSRLAHRLLTREIPLGQVERVEHLEVVGLVAGDGRDLVDLVVGEVGTVDAVADFRRRHFGARNERGTSKNGGEGEARAAKERNSQGKLQNSQNLHTNPTGWVSAISKKPGKQ